MKWSPVPSTVVVLAAVALATTACGATTGTAANSSPASAPASATASASGTASPAASTTPTTGSAPSSSVAHVITLDDPTSSTSCLSGTRQRDFGWYDATWKSTAQLDSIAFRLVGPHNVEVRGDPISLPPRDFGGRIDDGGLIRWAERSHLASDPFFVWPAREDADFMTPIKDQSGLLLFHLHFPAHLGPHQSASLGTLVARYTTGAGDTATTRLPTHESYRFASSRDC